MDASRFKRRTIQTPRQTTNANPATLNGFVARPVASSRPAPVQPLAKTQAVAPVWQRAPQPVVPAPAPQAPTPLPAPVEEPVAPIPAPEPALPQEAPAVQLDMSLPGGESGVRGLFSAKRMFTARKWAMRGAIAGLVLVVGVGGILFSQGAFKLHKVFTGKATQAAALKENVNPDLLKGEGDGRINVLLLGRGGGNHEAPDLTDTMMLVSIDPVNKTQSMVSIPRDLWVKVPNAGSMKINAAWETGEFRYLGKVAPGSTDPKAIQAGFDMVDQTVESVLGVPIHYNMIVDFAAFKQGVDSVGGVTVNVPTDLVDPTMAWENGKNPILAKAGIQNFDGTHALMYVRSRETTSDFARSQRQRAVMLALKAKVKSLGTLSNPLKISELINAFGNNVSTDLSLNNASRLYQITSDITDANTASIGLADKPNNYVTTANMNGQSVVLPIAGQGNYAAIQDYIHSQLKDGYIVQENAPVMVYNGTTLPGVATTTSNKLKSYGYNIVGAANTPNTGWTQTTLVDLSGGTAKYTLNYLQQRYKVKAVTSLPDPAITANGAKFVIIIGSDEATSTQN